MIRVILWLVFVSAPSILLPAYAVYKARGYFAAALDIEVPQFAYLVVLLAVMVAGYWLSSRKLIKRLRANVNVDESA